MRSIHAILFVSAALLAASCTGPRYASTTEYDDVYYSKSDRSEAVVKEKPLKQRDNYAYTPRRNAPVDNYYDAYYDDDDFYFSRRIRRFNQAGSNWRYYDPYFSNDLYYVINSPFYNRWNNYGWYNWNYPRFGSSFSLAWGSPYSGFGYGAGFNRFNRWNAYNYYNPWVGNYYGYSPYFGAGAFSPFSPGFGGFASSAYYCPPGYGGFTAFSPFRSGRVANNNNYVTRRRTSSTSATSPTTYSPRTSANNTRQTSSSTLRLQAVDLPEVLITCPLVHAQIQLLAPALRARVQERQLIVRTPLPIAHPEFILARAQGQVPTRPIVVVQIE